MNELETKRFASIEQERLNHTKILEKERQNIAMIYEKNIAEINQEAKGREVKSEDKYRSMIKNMKEVQVDTELRYKREVDEVHETVANQLQDQKNVASNQISVLTSQKDEEISNMTSMLTSANLKLDEKTVEFTKYKDQSAVQLEELISNQDDELERLTEKLNLIENDKMKLKEEMQFEKANIERDFNSQILKMKSVVEEKERDINKHEDAISGLKAGLEQEMKLFEAAKQSDFDKIVIANDEEKRILVEKLEKLTESTELKIRKSLDKIQYHKSEQQRLGNEAEKLEKDCQVIEGEKDELKAEKQVESREKMLVLIALLYVSGTSLE